jgi:hypothetical protein
VLAAQRLKLSGFGFRDRDDIDNLAISREFTSDGLETRGIDLIDPQKNGFEGALATRTVVKIGAIYR